MVPCDTPSGVVGGRPKVDPSSAQAGLTVANRRKASGELHPMWKDYGYSEARLNEDRAKHPHFGDASLNDMAEFSHWCGLGDGRDSYFDPGSWKNFQANGGGGNWYGPNADNKFAPQESIYTSPLVQEEYPGYDHRGNPIKNARRANRRTADIYCNGDGCNNIKAPPAEDWSRSKGIPFDMNTKHQYYFESGGDHPSNYDDDFEIPANWDSFGSWGGSGFCADCHPYKDKHPHPEAPGYNEWLQQNKSHPGKLPLRQDWDRGDPNDPRIKGSSRKADKHTLRRIDLRDMMDQEPQEDKPDIEHFAAKRAAAITYVAQCRRAGQRPTSRGLRQFMGSQQPKNRGLYDHYVNDTGPNFPGKTVVDFTDPQWQTKTNWDGSRYDADGSPVFPFVPHSDRVKGEPYFISPEHAHPKGWYGSPDYIEHRQTCPTCSTGQRHAPVSRRQAEHFDITEEGGTPKGKGKPSKKTTMSSPDAQWYRRNRGGRYT
jgi:hypothetical protein